MSPHLCIFRAHSKSTVSTIRTIVIFPALKNTFHDLDEPLEHMMELGNHWKFLETIPKYQKHLFLRLVPSNEDNIDFLLRSKKVKRKVKESQRLVMNLT
jgi:hypothetical protein